ncbi:MAG: hypothetical protein JWN66_2360, partial [Sphingomonas bacterium]|nr:hypothetical protein [Sphingomonas bacterium]
RDALEREVHGDNGKDATTDETVEELLARR